MFPILTSRNRMMNTFTIVNITLTCKRYRSSCQEVFLKKLFLLRNFATFTGKHLCQNLFFNKVAGPRPATLFKKTLWHRCFPVNFPKFLKTPFIQSNSRRLLLEIVRGISLCFSIPKRPYFSLQFGQERNMGTHLKEEVTNLF